ncbi:MAG: Uma2 family endonuclease [Cyanobacteria bacterium]|nr:Uma2 family endonuclease [Cyanobacteriota bacterium]MDW8200644.1 Uma2 family endonuclease [Cyanobacteriota bacterium SKYGB_h_bin112]
MTVTPIPRKFSSDELAERGWRYELVTLADGTTDYEMVPLTEDEFVHPQEGYHLPNTTFHDRIIAEARDMLTRRYRERPDVGVFSDLLIEWDSPDMKDHCPDVFVAFGITNKQQNRGKFIVANEGVRPTFVLEVVSPRYRRADRETKVLHYARTKVQEYVIVDRRRYRTIVLDEVLGYRLVGGAYQPITPDDDGRIFCETVGLWISLQEGHLVMQDGTTGERLLTSDELESIAEQERQRAEQERQRAEQERQRAEQERQRAEQMAAELQQLHDRLRSMGIDPDTLS